MRRCFLWHQCLVNLLQTKGKWKGKCYFLENPNSKFVIERSNYTRDIVSVEVEDLLQLDLWNPKLVLKVLPVKVRPKDEGFEDCISCRCCFGKVHNCAFWSLTCISQAMPPNHSSMLALSPMALVMVVGPNSSPSRWCQYFHPSPTQRLQQGMTLAEW